MQSLFLKVWKKTVDDKWKPPIKWEIIEGDIQPQWILEGNKIHKRLISTSLKRDVMNDTFNRDGYVGEKAIQSTVNQWGFSIQDFDIERKNYKKDDGRDFYWDGWFDVKTSPIKDGFEISSKTCLLIKKDNLEMLEDPGCVVTGLCFVKISYTQRKYWILGYIDRFSLLENVAPPWFKVPYPCQVLKMSDLAEFGQEFRKFIFRV